MPNEKHTTVLGQSTSSQSTSELVTPIQSGRHEEPSINRVSVKVPPFWDENPEIWFAQVEAQFANAGVIADLSRFNTVVAAIETKILTQITDAVLQPPETDKYLNLKTVLLERYGAS